MLGASCALRWPQGHELQGVEGGRGGGEAFIITCFLSLTKLSHRPNDWEVPLFINLKSICLFPLWPSEPLLKGKLFPSL